MVVLVDGRFRWIKVILKDLIVRQVDGSSLNWHHKIELGSFRACNFDQIRAKVAEIAAVKIASVVETEQTEGGSGGVEAEKGKKKKLI